MGIYFHVNLSGVQNFSFPTLFDSYRELLLNEMQQILLYEGFNEMRMCICFELLRSTIIIILIIIIIIHLI